MDIHFCDLCNESVPAPDFALGKAHMRKGRVVCASCERAMGTDPGDPSATKTVVDGAPGGPSREPSAAAGPPGRGARSVAQAGGPQPSEVAVQGASSWAGGASLFLATGALAVAVTGGMLLAERLDQVESTALGARMDSRNSVDMLRRERSSMIAPLKGELAAAQAAAGVSAGELRAATEAKMAALEAQLKIEQARGKELRALLDTTRINLEEARRRSAEDHGATGEEIASLQKVMQFHGDSIVEMRERIREAGALVASGQAAGLGSMGTGGAPLNGGPDSGAAAGGPGAPWARFLPNLAHEDEAQRLDAVLELGETGDPAVAEYIIPMLVDPDSFVRMVSVQALGDLRCKPAVPDLIDRLEDDRWAVREAARDALRNVTGKNFSFDPTAKDLDRKKRVEQWRGWWRREGDDFLTGR